MIIPAGKVVERYRRPCFINYSDRNRTRGNSDWTLFPHLVHKAVVIANIQAEQQSLQRSSMEWLAILRKFAGAVLFHYTFNITEAEW